MSLGLKHHLQSHFPAMWCLYLELASHPKEPHTLQELQIASNRISLDSKVVTDYLQSLEEKTGPLIDAFKRAAMTNEVYPHLIDSDLLIDFTGLMGSEGI